MPSPGTGVGTVTFVIRPENHQSRLPAGSYDRTLVFATVTISVRRPLRQMKGVDHALTSSRPTLQFCPPLAVSNDAR